MKWLDNMHISRKMIIGFLSMVVFMLIVGYTGIMGSRVIHAELREIFQVRLPSLNYLLQADRDMQQALVAERTMIFTDVKSDRFKELVGTYNENADQVVERWNKYKALPAEPEETALFPEFDRALEDWQKSSRAVVDNRELDTRDGRRLAIDLTQGEAGEKFEIAREFLNKLQEINLDIAQKGSDRAEAIYANILKAIGIVLLLGVIFGLLLSWVITQGIVRPIRGVITFARKISQGDTSMRLPMGTAQKCADIQKCQEPPCPCYDKTTHCWVEAGSYSMEPTCPHVRAGNPCQTCRVYKRAGMNEINEMGAGLNAMAMEIENKARITTQMAAGDLRADVRVISQDDVFGTALKGMIENLNQLLREVKQAIAQVTNGSRQIADSSQSLSSGATEQAAALEQITSSMTEMGAQTKANAENAIQADSLAAATRQSAESGNAHMQDMIEAMGRIRRSSREISKIIKAIDDIAFQTNLLALNAAVEAARAGKHGKGFAVVAQEVRNLASRSAKAASETSELIEGSLREVEQGGAIMEETARALSGIVDGAVQVKDILTEIAAASNEQAQGLAQINQGLAQVEQVTQQNTANAEETASAAVELASQADALENLVRKFKLRDHPSTPTGTIPSLPQSVPRTIHHSSATEHRSIHPSQTIHLSNGEFNDF